MLKECLHRYWATTARCKRVYLPANEAAAHLHSNPLTEGPTVSAQDKTTT